jgi:formate dehydrogenase subunit gamma
MLINHRQVLQFPALLFLILIAFPVFAENAPSSNKPVTVPNPASDLWRAVNPQQLPPAQAAMFPRGDSQVRGVQSGVLINQQGQIWRHFRMKQLLPTGGYLLAGAMLAVLLFYFIRGKVLIRDGESDKKIERYSVYERMIHWFMAFIFLFLGFSGLILLFGRSLLLPWMGPELFSILASAAKEGHNLFGSLFLLALVLMFLKFVIRNIYQEGDLTWLLKGGGIIGEHDVPSNFFNMGEKTLFWLLIIVGGLIAISGLVLLFPVFGQGRDIMELSHVVHAIAALIMLTVIIGHIYIGTIGMQGATEGMTSGYCDLNWAKDHHSWWAQRCIDEGKVLPKQQGQGADAHHDNPGSREAEK